MIQADILLADLWAAHEAPAQDAAFVITVMEKVQRARQRRMLLSTIGGAFAVGLLIWALAPVLAALARATALTNPSIVGPLASALIMGLSLWSWTSRPAPQPAH